MVAVKVKICGITNLKDAQAALGAGCDALGFIFHKKSPRYIRPAEVKAIVKRLPKGIIKVGVFVDAQAKRIKHIAKLCGLNLLQFHGKEPPEFCAQFKGYKIIKAFRVKKRIDIAQILEYRLFAYLFDAYLKTKPGGTGRRFDWRLLRPLKKIKKPIFLSGGLTKDNLQQAIQAIQPDWVDACSWLEIRPGKKDHKKIREFIQAARGTIL